MSYAMTFQKLTEAESVWLEVILNGKKQ